MEVLDYFPPTQSKITKANKDVSDLIKNNDEQSLLYIADVLRIALRWSLAKNDIIGADTYSQIIERAALAALELNDRSMINQQ